MNHIQKNAIEFETGITRHETIRHDSVCDVMHFRKFIDTLRQKFRGFIILALFCTNGDSGTVLYATVLILTEGLRKSCGNTSEKRGIASSAPALFILVQYCSTSTSATSHFL